MRRAVAGMAVAATAVGGYAAYKHAPAVTHKVGDSVHQATESTLYSEYHLFNAMQANGGFDSGKVLTYEITSDEGENPTSIAQKLHAKDVTLVAKEIAGQEGGDHLLQAGDTVVLPLNQFNGQEGGVAPAGSVVSVDRP